MAAPVGHSLHVRHSYMCMTLGTWQ